MSQMAKDARRAMRDKAVRLTQNDPHKKVDGSSWEPTESLNAGRKTGARPIRPKIYKAGGAVQGDRGPIRADKKPRGTGSLSMANVPAENAEAFGNYHVGGYKNGGKPKKWIQGAIKHPGALHKTLGVPKGEKIPEKKMEKAEHSSNPKTAKRARLAETLKGMHHKDGGRAERAHGGKAKGKTNINIVIAQPKQQPMVPAAPMPPPPGPVPIPAPPPMGGPNGMPAGGPPPGAMPPPGMMGRKDGGPVMHAGAGGGKGRLEKIALQRRSTHKKGGMVHLTGGAGSGVGRLEKAHHEARK